jgi:hypothetical protein
MKLPNLYQAKAVKDLQSFYGVEFWRQQTPLNLGKIVRLLIDHGADVNAKMKMYGGFFTPYQLLPSSFHLRAAGITSQLRKLFFHQ